MAMDEGNAALGAAEAESRIGERKTLRYDCGWLGCDEIPMVTRRLFQSVEVGDVIEFLVREPSSKEDTPPFCRMLGHRILSIEEQEDGARVIAVERAR